MLILNDNRLDSLSYDGNPGILFCKVCNYLYGLWGSRLESICNSFMLVPKGHNAQGT